MIIEIELENMEFHSYHGCYDLEKKVGNHFLVSLKIAAETGDAAERDELLATINYADVYNLVKAQMQIKSNTLENVAIRIINTLYTTYNQIVNATVKVSKLAPPIGGKMERFTVTITK